MSHPKTNTKNVLKNPSSNSQSKTTGRITNEKEESGRPPVEYRFNEPDSPQTIQYEEGTNKIKLATFSKLIEHVTSPKLNDSMLLKEIMLTYHSFATSKELFTGLIERFKTSPSDSAKVIRLRVFAVFKHWIDNHWHDFSKDRELISELEKFCRTCVQYDPSLKAPAEQVATSLHNKVNSIEATLIATPGYRLPPKLPKNPNDPIMKVDPEEVARQLTLIDFDLFSKIQPYECHGQAWLKKDRDKRAPGIVAMTEHFNYISGWVATTILTTEDFVKRTRVIDKFLTMAKFCLRFGNLNTALAIFSGLDAGPVFRLEKTFSALSLKSKRTLADLREVLNSEKSYKAMREYLMHINPPCIPYLGMFLTDLTFIEEGNKDYINNLINFKKRRQIAETILKIMQYQQQGYLFFEPVESIQKKLKSLTVLPQEVLYECSYYLEPRAGQERPPRPDAIPPPKPSTGSSWHKLSITFGMLGKPVQPSASPSNETSDSNLRSPRLDLDYPPHYPFQEDDTPNNIQFDNSGLIKAGTLTKIIERLTHHRCPDVVSLPAFLATYRTFCSPMKLLHLLIARFNMPPPKNKTPENLKVYSETLQAPVGLRVLNILKCWIDKHYYDFEDNTLKTKLLEFINGVLAHNPLLANWASVLKATIAKKEDEKKNPPLPSTVEPPPRSHIPSVPPSVDVNSTTIEYFHSEEVARQLSLHFFQLFEAIKPSEFLVLSLKWVPGDINKQPLTANELQTKAPNGTKFQQAVDTLRTLIDSDLNQAIKEQKFVKVLEKWLEVLFHCSNFHNWQVVKTTVGCLSKHYIQEKLALWQNVASSQKKFFFQMKELCSRKNISLFRNKILETSPPTVPALNVVLRGIAELEQKLGRDLVGNGMLINFQKKYMQGEILVNLQRMQSIPYNFLPVEVIQKYLKKTSFTTSQTSELSSSLRYSEPSIDRAIKELMATDPDFKAKVQELLKSDAAIRKEEKFIKSDSESESVSSASSSSQSSSSSATKPFMNPTNSSLLRPGSEPFPNTTRLFSNEPKTNKVDTMGVIVTSNPPSSKSGGSSSLSTLSPRETLQNVPIATSLKQQQPILVIKERPSSTPPNAKETPPLNMPKTSVASQTIQTPNSPETRKNSLLELLEAQINANNGSGDNISTISSQAPQSNKTTIGVKGSLSPPPPKKINLNSSKTPLPNAVDSTTTMQTKPHPIPTNSISISSSNRSSTLGTTTTTTSSSSLSSSPSKEKTKPLSPPMLRKPISSQSNTNSKLSQPFGKSSKPSRKSSEGYEQSDVIPLSCLPQLTPDTRPMRGSHPFYTLRSTKSNSTTTNSQSNYGTLRQLPKIPQPKNLLTNRRESRN